MSGPHRQYPAPDHIGPDIELFIWHYRQKKRKKGKKINKHHRFQTKIDFWIIVLEYSLSKTATHSNYYKTFPHNHNKYWETGGTLALKIWDFTDGPFVKINTSITRRGVNGSTLGRNCRFTPKILILLIQRCAYDVESQEESKTDLTSKSRSLMSVFWGPILCLTSPFSSGFGVKWASPSGFILGHKHLEMKPHGFKHGVVFMLYYVQIGLNKLKSVRREDHILFL